MIFCMNLSLVICEHFIIFQAQFLSDCSWQNVLQAMNNGNCLSSQHSCILAVSPPLTFSPKSLEVLTNCISVDFLSRFCLFTLLLSLLLGYQIATAQLTGRNFLVLSALITCLLVGLFLQFMCASAASRLFELRF